MSVYPEVKSRNLIKGSRKVSRNRKGLAKVRGISARWEATVPKAASSVAILELEISAQDKGGFECVTGPNFPAGVNQLRADC